MRLICDQIQTSLRHYLSPMRARISANFQSCCRRFNKFINKVYATTIPEKNRIENTLDRWEGASRRLLTTPPAEERRAQPIHIVIPDEKRLSRERVQPPQEDKEGSSTSLGLLSTAILGNYRNPPSSAGTWIAPDPESRHYPAWSDDRDRYLSTHKFLPSLGRLANRPSWTRVFRHRPTPPIPDSPAFSI